MTYIPLRKQPLFTTKHSLRGRKIRSFRLLRITQKKNLKEKNLTIKTYNKNNQNLTKMFSHQTQSHSHQQKIIKPTTIHKMKTNHLMINIDKGKGTDHCQEPSKP